MATTLRVTTPVGEFTRKTDTAYTHIVVWNSKRAQAAVADPERYAHGVSGRWIKDSGFGVTWHTSERTARTSAAKGAYAWDRDSTLVGVFAVAG